jgi:hypothetical protein
MKFKTPAAAVDLAKALIMGLQRLAGAASVIFTLSANLLCAPISFSGKNCYLGVLHAHSALSPDFRPKPTDKATFLQLVKSNSNERFLIPNNPYQAYMRAADLGKLDFLAITDHVHGPEGGEAEYCSHEMPAGGYQLIFDSAAKINADSRYKEKFLAIPGFEWSVINGSNHANILFARKPVPQSIRNGNFKDLYNGYLNNSGFEHGNPLLLVQLNHPNQVSPNIGYGRDAFAGASAERDFVNFFRDTFLAIEHINGSSNGGNNNTLEKNAHQEGDSLETYYRRYLNMGFRLSPVGDHDNHRANWGRHTAARTGVWADSLKPRDFVAAYKARRVFATEDNELAVAFLTGSNWMGSVVRVPSAGQTRTFRVMVGQVPDTERGQVLDEGPYIVEVIADDGFGGAGPRPVRFVVNGQAVLSARVRQGETLDFQYRVSPGTYCYLHVKETRGRDSGGQSADAWTAPIFFVN